MLMNAIQALQRSLIAKVGRIGRRGDRPRHVWLAPQAGQLKSQTDKGPPKWPFVSLRHDCQVPSFERVSDNYGHAPT